MSAPIVHLATANAAQFSEGFAEWLSENLHVWRAFEREATRVFGKRGGSRAVPPPHYSARTIVEVLRHNSLLNEKGGQWKINDHHAPDLARLYHLVYPSRAGFFELRRRTATLGR